MAHVRSFLASLALTSTVAGAQVLPPDGAPLRIDVETLLDLDGDRAAQVDAILRGAHGRMRAAREQIGSPTDEITRGMMRAAVHAIRFETDRQLAAVLTADELQKLHEAMPRPPLFARPLED